MESDRGHITQLEGAYEAIFAAIEASSHHLIMPLVCSRERGAPSTSSPSIILVNLGLNPMKQRNPIVLLHSRPRPHDILVLVE
jgi:hypothetical protein